MEKLKVYVVSGYSESQPKETIEKIKLRPSEGRKEVLSSQSLYGSNVDNLDLLKKRKLPTLKEVVSAIYEDMNNAGVSEWSATIELELKVGTGSIIPGGSAGIKTTVNIKGKPTEAK